MKFGKIAQINNCAKIVDFNFQPVYVFGIVSMSEKFIFLIDEEAIVDYLKNALNNKFYSEC